MISWSYSVLNSFETCPRRHYLTKVAKTVVEQQNEQMLHGNRVHKALEMRLKEKRPLPVDMAGYEKYAVRVEQSAIGGRLFAEQQLALDARLNKTSWFGKGANTPWVRVITDFTVLKGNKAFIGDWKTGRREPESAQLRLSAAATFAVMPEVDVIHNSFVWLKEQKVDAEVFRRGDAPTIWQEFAPRVRKLEKAHEDQQWPPRPSGLCRKYCPVPHHMCEHRG